MPCASESHCAGSVPSAVHLSLASCARCSQSTSQLSGGGGLHLAWQAVRTVAAAAAHSSALPPCRRQRRSTRAARASHPCPHAGGGWQCSVTQVWNSSIACDLQSSDVPPSVTQRPKSARACSSQSAAHVGASGVPPHFSATQWRAASAARAAHSAGSFPSATQCCFISSAALAHRAGQLGSEEPPPQCMTHAAPEESAALAPG